MRRDTQTARIIELNRRFHDQAEAPHYDQRMGVRHDAEAVAAMLQELERVHGAPLPGGTVVDVGAGTGNAAVKLAIDGRFDRVVAIDISAKMLEVAARSAASHGVTLETVVSDMQSLPVADASVELVVGCAILHHLPDPAAFLREVHRILRPGGSAIFIGEPGRWGARVTELVKAPLVAVARALRGAKRVRWAHEDIDVHTFTLDDIEEIATPFAELSIRPAGLLEPIVDQALLAPALQLAGDASPVTAIARATRRALRAVDAQLEPRVPPSLLASVKFCARKAA